MGPDKQGGDFAMKDFGEWFAAQGKVEDDPEEMDYDSVGLWWSVNRMCWMARCRHCQEDYEILWEPWEHTEEGNYCGKGGPSPCIP